jgi:hypothetical protein
MSCKYGPIESLITPGQLECSLTGHTHDLKVCGSCTALTRLEADRDRQRQSDDRWNDQPAWWNRVAIHQELPLWSA